MAFIVPFVVQTIIVSGPLSGGQIIAKPALGTQSVGVLKFERRLITGESLIEGIAEAIDRDRSRYGMPISLEDYSASANALIIQPFVDGIEITIDGHLSGDDCSFVTHRKVATVEGAFARDGILIGPFALEDHFCETVGAALRDVFDKACVGAWSFHAEAILRDNALFLIEINPRPAGGLIPESVESLTGGNMFRDLAQIIAGGRPGPLRFLKAGYSSEITVYPPGNGTISAISGIEDIVAMPGYICHRICADVGTEVQIVDREEYGVLAVIRASSLAEITRHAEAISAMDHHRCRAAYRS